MIILRIIKKFNNEIDFIPGKKVSGAPKLTNYKRSHSTTRILICLHALPRRISYDCPVFI